MFREIRERVSLPEAIERYTDKKLEACGTDTYELADKECPFCEHSDCFKVKHNSEESFFKCFSCGEFGSDATSFYSILKKLPAGAAAKQIIKDFNIPIEQNVSRPQQIFNQAAEYFYQCMLESKDEIVKDGVQYTPLEYQVKYRKHSKEALKKHMVGWNGGELLRYLASFDFTEEEVAAAGLAMKNAKTGKIFAYLKKGCFVYPHFCKGSVSHFTQKDPTGETPPYQIKNEFRLNNHMFYGQDSVEKNKRIAIVEGENDLISLSEYADGAFGIIASIGTPSGAQKKWIEMHCAEKEVITIFDRDEAGEKYRNMFWKLTLPKLTQFVVPEPFKDIDELLKQKEDGNLDELIECQDPAKQPIDGAEVVEGNSIFEIDGYYGKIKINATSGERSVVKVSNFTIRLRNIFIMGDNERSREIIVRRQDGVSSKPLIVTSEMKVSMRSFKEAIANAIDASFYGSENDLAEMWDFVYAKGGEREVWIPKEVGHINSIGGWLFGDCFITPNGSIIEPDDEGVMWINGNSSGIKPASINVKNKSKAIPADIPRIRSCLTKKQQDDLEADFVRQFIKNIGDVGAALTMLSWTYANAYSDIVFDRYGFFPFLFLWGRHSKGKTTITKWLLGIYGMDGVGTHSVPQMKTGVGFGRTLSYFSSLPLMLDEVRADKECKDFYGHFRAWYNRQGRSMGTKEADSILTQEVKANVIFCGQDVFTDTATRSRCVEVHVPTHGRELHDSYRWVEQNFDDLKCIGLKWVLETTTLDREAFYKSLTAREQRIMEEAKCDNRSAKHWSLVSYFAEKLLAAAKVEFDMHDYIVKACQRGFEEQKVDDLVLRFFTTIEGMQVAEHSEISGSHIKVHKGMLYMWIPELIRLLRRGGGMGEGERFSKNAIAAALRDETYFAGEERIPMGSANVRQRCYAFRLDLEDTPECVQNIAQVAENQY